MAQIAIDDKIPQRLLFVTSDLLGNAITEYGQSLERVKKLGAFFVDPTTNKPEYTFDPEDAINITRKQQELFSDSAIPSSKSSYEIFSDEKSPVPIDTMYYISTNVLMYFGGIPYYFNVDEFNSINKKVFISKLFIKNRSKDAFTLKANYLVTLKINFTSFDDLLEPTLVVTSAKDKKIKLNLAPMHLLYKFFDQKNAPSEFRHLPNADGIFLNQTLNFNTDSSKYKFKTLSSDLGGTSFISKNYHLTFHKHSFDMFKTEEPIFKYFENELTIEYIAYEADGVDKPLGPDEQKIIPKVNSNLYRLLDQKNLSDSQLLQKNFMGDSGKDANGNVLDASGIFGLQDIISELNKNNKLIEEYIKKLQCAPETQAGAMRKKIQQDLEKIQNKNQYLKVYANRLLIFTILRVCQIYRISVPYNLLAVYERNSFWELFSKNVFSISNLWEGVKGAVGTEVGFGALGAASAAVSAGSIGAAATTIGAGATTAVASLLSWPALLTAGSFYVGWAAISAYNDPSKNEVWAGNMNVNTIRKSVADIIKDGLKSPSDSTNKFVIENRDKFLDLALGQKSLNDGNNKAKAIETTGDFSEIKGLSQAGTDKMKAICEKMALNEVMSQSDVNAGTEVLIHFTTFGDIMNILTQLDPSKELRIISGCYTIEIQDTDGIKSAFNNFTNIPITINSLSKFLYSMIEATDRNLNYDSELFFRDCYENLVKAVLADGYSILPTLEKNTPKNIKVISTLHALDETLAKEYNDFGNINILDTSKKFDNFKKFFIKTKNFNLASSGMGDKKIIKMYVIGTHEEVKYYNFFDDYRNWIDSAGEKSPYKNYKFIYNSYAFQEYINIKHLIPCLLMRSITDADSILKKKYVSFSRIDNPNLNTGNFINKYGQLRYPYQFKADFKAYMTFFLDIGSHIFVAPPSSKAESEIYNQVNMFGFGGLYLATAADFEYSFQRIVNGNITLPNFESKLTLDAFCISHGDGINSKATKTKNDSKETQDCSAPTIINNQPVTQPTSTPSPIVVKRQY